ncbi:hypothetical protein EVAR_25333_1 [Eumeta japonica]|uniref:Uncharacterized protein n=1 Tax=Eumeta variegata TaxID=151549 RepID=A0A4C1Y088_EUMVA|nr:hypothetical protein EVAR_25333_1 [Eumeta japonica]
MNCTVGTVQTKPVRDNYSYSINTNHGQQIHVQATRTYIKASVLIKRQFLDRRFFLPLWEGGFSVGGSLDTAARAQQVAEIASSDATGIARRVTAPLDIRLRADN